MADEITWEDVKNTAIDIIDELDAFTPAQEGLVIDMATRKISRVKFNDDTFDARRYYAAHTASMAVNPPAGEGTQSSESIGSVSAGVTLAVNNPKPDQNILSTVYGREYWRLLQANFQSFQVG